MSFLSILLFSSAFYFAYARPNRPEGIVSFPIATLPKMQAADPSTDGSGRVYDGLPGYLVDMSKILDRYVPTFDPDMDPEEQVEKKAFKDRMDALDRWFGRENSSI